MEERRGYERLGVTGKAALGTGDAAAALHDGCLENIGFGGFGISAQDKLQPQDAVTFDLTVTTAGESLSGKGIIRHAQEKTRYDNKIFIIGVEFTDVNKDLLIYLIKKIQSRLARQKKGQSQGGASFMPF